jgi:hypothetical protein
MLIMWWMFTHKQSKYICLCLELLNLCTTAESNGSWMWGWHCQHNFQHTTDFRMQVFFCLQVLMSHKDELVLPGLWYSSHLAFHFVYSRVNPSWVLQICSISIINMQFILLSCFSLFKLISINNYARNRSSFFTKWSLNSFNKWSRNW